WSRALNLRLRHLAYLAALGASFGAGLLLLPPRNYRLPEQARMPDPVLLTCAAASDRGCLPVLPGRDIEVAPGPTRSVAATVAPTLDPEPLARMPIAAAEPAPSAEPSPAVTESAAPPPTSAPSPAELAPRPRM